MPIEWQDTEEDEKPPADKKSPISWKETDDSALDDAHDAARQYFYGFNEALYNASGWSFIDEAVSMTGIADKGTVGNWVKKNVFRAGDIKPKTKTQKFMRSAGEGTAFGALSAMGTGIVAQLSTKAPLAAKTSEKVMESIVNAWRANPTSFSLWETITATGEEGARQAAEDAGSGVAGQTIAGVAGALSPVAAYAGAKGAIKHFPTAYLFRHMSGKPQPWTSAQERSAVREVSEALETGIGDTDQLVASKQALDRLGVSESASVAEASGSPQLLAKQQSIESRATGSELDNLVARKVRGGQEVRQAGVDGGPDSLVSEGQIADSVVSRYEASIRRFDEGLNEIESIRSITGDDLLPEANRVDIGETLRNRRRQLRKDAGDEFSQRADDIGLNSPEEGLNASSFVREIEARFFSKKNKFANKERAEILHTIRSLKGEDGAVDFSFEDVKSLRKRLNNDISTAMNSDKQQASELIETKKLLDDWFSEVDPPSSVDPAQWSAFRIDYKRDFIQRFEQGVAYKLGKRKPQGDYQTTDEAVADQFLRNESTAGDFYRIYSDKDGNLDPLASQSMRDAIIDKARSYAVSDGAVDEKKLALFIKRNEKVLSLFPNESASLRDARRVVQDLSGREAVLRQRRDLVGKAKLRVLLGKSGDPDELINASLNNPRSMRALIRSSQAAGLGREPVQAAIWRRAMDTVSEDGLPSPQGIHGFIKKHEAELKVLYSDSPGHLQRLDDIYTGLMIFNRTPVPSGTPQASGTVGRVEQYVGTGIAQASSRVFAVQSGRTGKFYPMIDGFVRFVDRMTKRRADALMKRALLDPKVASDVHAAISAERMPRAIERRLNAYLFNMGYGASESEVKKKLEQN